MKLIKELRNVIPAIFTCFETTFPLEIELRLKLHDASSLFFCRDAEVRVGLRDLLGHRILRKLQGQIAAVRERPQRMVEEVIGLRTELQTSTFRHLEVLEYAKVGVEEPRAVGCRQHRRTVLADGKIRREAGSVYISMRPLAGVRIAGHDWIELLRRRSQDGLVVDRNACRVL